MNADGSDLEEEETEVDAEGDTEVDDAFGTDGDPRPLKPPPKKPPPKKPAPKPHNPRRPNPKKPKPRNPRGGTTCIPIKKIDVATIDDTTSFTVEPSDDEEALERVTRETPPRTRAMGNGKATKRPPPPPSDDFSSTSSEDEDYVPGQPATGQKKTRMEVPAPPAATVVATPGGKNNPASARGVRGKLAEERAKQKRQNEERAALAKAAEPQAARDLEQGENDDRLNEEQDLSDYDHGMLSSPVTPKETEMAKRQAEAAWEAEHAAHTAATVLLLVTIITT